MSSASLAEFEFRIGAHISRGDLAGAAAIATACRAAWPTASVGWLLGSIVALMNDDKETALALVEERLEKQPVDVQCTLQRAESLMALGRRDESLAAAATAAGFAGADPQALDAIGQFLVHSAAHLQALEIYDRALAAAPTDVSLWAKRAVIHRFLGNFDLAAENYGRMLAVSPADADALKGLVELRRQSAEQNSVEGLAKALEMAAPESKEAATLHFGLAKSYEDLGQYATSWRHLSTANRLERARIKYDADMDREVIDRIGSCFTQVETPTADTTGECPIFIVGLPRTGTTLIDRIIGSHSRVHSAGEMPALSEAIGTAVNRLSPETPRSWMGYAAMLGSLDGEMIAREYLLRVRSRRGQKGRFSDKQPTNFLYCALILRAFPNARIVHVTRHPLAACYAIHKTRFRGTYPFAYDLMELGKFYIGYHNLMLHWHRILPGRILDVSYESVVTTLEPSVRRLLEYTNLPFEQACLHFHLNPEPTATASSVQVRQPLYDSSLGQWQNYAVELQGLRSLLEAAGVATNVVPALNAPA